MDIRELTRTGHLTKLFDGSRIPEEKITVLLELLRSAPSSVNMQPGRYFVASTSAAKDRVAKAMTPIYDDNLPKLRSASHIIVCCSRLTLPADYLQELKNQMIADGKFSDAQSADNWHVVARFADRLHTYERRDLGFWLEKQVYLAVGVALMGAASLSLDICPLEGFHPNVLDAELGLPERGLTSVVLLAVGRRSPADYAIGTPKSRLPFHQIVSSLDGDA